MGQVSEQVNQKAFGWAATDPSAVFSPFTFSRGAMGENDVTFKVLYCGICHSDLHMAKNELGEFCTYPLVPGHEIFGIVTEIGSKAALSTMDGIIDTEKPPGLPVFPLLMGRKIVGGYASGGMKETQEMLYFASQHNIAAYIDVIPMEYLNTAMDRLVKGDIRY
ncbi:hypothetical protein Pint_27745 [Pistacia integerrima]|uniref:Uncharacterized protein n=1 Tax=Pistacia integerrima TaxID=434235 RepID=A0ACC0YN81_9ROSI|nr:hypothetical protein Pint_27745 [Pistacia integerrima]